MPAAWPSPVRRRRFAVGCLLLGTLALAAPGVRAQPAAPYVVRDGSLGSGPLDVSGVPITEDMGDPRGGNLFHSFERFHVPTGEVVTFVATPTRFQNLLARVTGAEASSIDGTLASPDVPNLYLMNPNGIVFGPGARLDVPGSFHATTADTVRVGEKTIYTFANEAPAALVVDGALLLLGGDAPELSLVGGDVEIRGGSLDAPGGVIRIASVGAPGDVVSGTDGAGPILRADGFERLGAISLAEGAQVDASQAGFVLLRGATLSLDDAEIRIENSGASDGGRIEAELDGDLVVGAEGVLRTLARGEGDAADVRLEVARLVLRDGGRIESRTKAGGATGSLHVDASQAILIAGFAPRVADDREGTDPPKCADEDGDGGSGGGGGGGGGGGNQGGQGGRPVEVVHGESGRIRIVAGDLSLSSGGRVESDTRGPVEGASIEVETTGPVFLGGRAKGSGDRSTLALEAEDGSSGRLGEILLTSPVLRMEDGRIEAKNRAAEDAVDAGGGGGGGGGEGSGAGIILRARGSGDAGDLVLVAPSVRMADGRIAMLTFGPGNGGDLNLTTGDLMLRGGADDGTSQIGNIVQDRKLAIGQGGNVSITAHRVDIQDADISASSESCQAALIEKIAGDRNTDAGRSGDVRITVHDTMRIGPKGLVTVETKRANAGEVDLQVGALLYLEEGAIKTSVADEEGNGGDITIDPVFVVLDQGTIEARAFRGRGGNISITTDFLFATPDRVIDASSALGIDGTIHIDAPEVDIAGTLTALPQDFVDAASLLREQCAARAAGSPQGSLLVTGRDGLPSAMPDAFSMAPLRLGDGS